MSEDEGAGATGEASVRRRSSTSSFQIPQEPVGPVYPFPRLTDRNYPSWSLRVEMSLKRDQLWTYVSDPPRFPTPEDKVRDEKAQALIVLSLSDHLLVYVRGKKTAKACWDSLRDNFVRESTASIVTLTRRLYRARLHEGGDMRAHLRKMQELFQDLESKGLTFDELQKSMTVLSSLDESWDTFGLTLESVGTQALTLSYVSSRLMEESDKRAENEILRGKSQPTKGLANKQHKQLADPEGTVEINTAVRKCFICKNENHIAKNCPHKKKGRKTQYQNPSCKSKYQVSVIHSGLQNSDKNKEWIVDSGSNENICSNKELFTNLKRSSKQSVALANGTAVPVQAVGSVDLPELDLCLQDVLYVPNLTQNLLSVSCITKQGYSVNFHGDECVFRGPQQQTVTAKARNGIFLLQHKKSAKQDTQVNSLNKPVHSSCEHVWHKRLGHPCMKYLELTAQQARGLDINQCHVHLDCVECGICKAKRAELPKQSTRQTAAILDLIHCDLAGPVTPPSRGGASYILCICDDYSRFATCILLKSKSEACDRIKGWINQMETRFEKKVKQIQSDRGGEFKNRAFCTWLEEKGIQQRYSAPYCPEENGIIERKLSHIQTVKDCLMQNSGFKRDLWGEILLTACFLVNRTFSRAVGNIPYTLFFGRQPNLSYLRSIGCKGFVKIPRHLRRKNEPKAKILRLIGYDPGSKAYRFLDSDGKSVVVSRDVQWCNEIAPSDADLVSLPPEKPLQKWSPQLPSSVAKATPAAERQAKLHRESPQQLEEDMELDFKVEATPASPAQAKEEELNDWKSESSSSPKRRFSRVTRGIPPVRYGTECSHAYHNALCEPQTYQDVLALPAEEQQK